MNRYPTLQIGLAFLIGVLPMAIAAQPVAQATTQEQPAAASVQSDPVDSAEAPITITHPNIRPADRRGLNVFEPPKSDADRLGNAEPRLRVGAGFAQQFQALEHESTALARWTPNTATPAPDDSINTNQLMDLGPGFNLASANLSFDALLTDGVHVNLVTYLSSRHHQEAWVKGGYIQVDAMRFLGVPMIDEIMNYATLKVGHYEVNYGDAHFRRTDNGNAMHNPFVGNYIMDAFTTEIGGELLLRHAGVLGMVGVTGGELNGNVTAPEGRSWTVITKLGIDRQVSPALRLRLTGSMYHNGNAARNTLYGGDRAGSRYFYVLENTQATTSAQFTSGLINPGFTEEITAFQLNPFVKFHGFELFGVIERASGRSALESEDVGRAWTQYAIDAVYRFLPQEQAFLGARYNTVSGALAGPVQSGAITTAGPDITINRMEIGAGWFATRNILLKAEYVRQQYNDFPALDIRNGGEFNGFMVEGVVAF